jgi:hypothetical protein
MVCPGTLFVGDNGAFLCNPMNMGVNFEHWPRSLCATAHPPHTRFANMIGGTPCSLKRQRERTLGWCGPCAGKHDGATKLGVPKCEVRGAPLREPSPPARGGLRGWIGYLVRYLVVCPKGFWAHFKPRPNFGSLARLHAPGPCHARPPPGGRAALNSSLISDVTDQRSVRDHRSVTSLTTRH